MFGAFLDAAMSIPRNMQMEEDRNQRQQDAWGHTFNDQAFTREMTSAAQAFTREMSNTAHQRQVADLRAAGLNPVLAARAAGASSGFQATASGGSSSSGGGGAHGSASSNFSAAALQQEQEKLLGEQQDLTRAQRLLTSADYNVRLADQDLRQEQVRTQEQLTASARHQANILGEDEKGRKLEGSIDETKYGEVMRYIDRAMRALTGGASAYRNVQP